MIEHKDVRFVSKVYQEMYNYLNLILIGQENVKRTVVTAMLCDANSRILLTGNTGTGKTTLAKALAKSFNTEAIAMLPDLLPSDILNQLSKNPNMQFLQIDELNRASSKVSSAFIELFEENQMSIDEKTFNFKPFYVFATQNNTDIAGIFNVSQALYDRFDVALYFNCLSKEDKRVLLFGDFKSQNKYKIATEYLYAVHQIVDRFSFSTKDQDLLMKIFSLVDNLKINGNYLFSGDNVRGHLYAKKMASLTAMANGRNYILAADLVDYLKPIYLHRLNQSQFSIEDIDVWDKFDELEQTVLKKVR